VSVCVRSGDALHRPVGFGFAQPEPQPLQDTNHRQIRKPHHVACRSQLRQTLLPLLQPLLLL
jgi:hypothetical protein